MKRDLRQFCVAVCWYVHVSLSVWRALSEPTTNAARGADERIFILCNNAIDFTLFTRSKACPCPLRPLCACWQRLCTGPARQRRRQRAEAPRQQWCEVPSGRNACRSTPGRRRSRAWTRTARACRTDSRTVGPRAPPACHKKGMHPGGVGLGTDKATIPVSALVAVSVSVRDGMLRAVASSDRTPQCVRTP